MVIGFNSHKKYFLRLLKNGELAHAYLFVGPEAIGKKMLALEIAAENDKNLLDTSVVVPDQEKSLGTISIEQIRGLAGFLATTPAFGKKKFVVIDDAHRLTDESANALLKSIEEPYASLVWILVTHQPDILPATIRSRCQEVRFLPQGDAAVEDLSEVQKLSAKDRQILMALAQGRLGWVKTAMSEDRMEAMREAVAQWEKLSSLSTLDRLVYAKTLAQKEQISQVASWWLAWLRSNLSQMPARARSASKLLALLPILQQSQFNHRLALENFLLGL